MKPTTYLIVPYSSATVLSFPDESQVYPLSP